MSERAADDRLDFTAPGELPEIIPIFPLMGVLLLPGRTLPLNVFEPRYLNMVRDAMAGPRLIGMIQPQAREQASPDDRPEIYRTGCAGRILAFQETQDGRILITLTGLCRFHVLEELPLSRGYRRVRADFQRYGGDLQAAGVAIDRSGLTASLRAYLESRGIDADWSVIDETPDEELVNALAMICPFTPQERQLLLEAPTTEERARVMTGLMEMHSVAPGAHSETRH